MESQVLRYGVIGALVLGLALPAIGADIKHGDLSAEHGVIEGKVDGVQTSVDGVQSSVDGVQSSVNTVNGKVDNLETLIMDLQDSVDMLTPEPDFTFPGDGLSGAPLQYQDNLDGTFTDLNTGLMWEMKVAGGGTCRVDLHAVNAACDWEQATGAWITAINAEGGTGFAGHNDWRVPTVKELQSLIDYSTVSPAVSAGFPGAVAATDYWSSTQDAGDALDAWVVNFNDSDIFSVLKDFTFRVRAVRGGS